jgi:hypothetical protein
LRVEHVSDDAPQTGPASGRAAALLTEIATILRVDPVIFFDGEIRRCMGQDLAADEVAELLALLRAVDGPNLREAAQDLIRVLKRSADGTD